MHMLTTNAILITWGSPSKILKNQVISIDKEQIREFGRTAHPWHICRSDMRGRPNPDFSYNWKSSLAYSIWFPEKHGDNHNRWGKILMKERELLTRDKVDITARAKELSLKVWERYEEKF